MISVLGDGEDFEIVATRLPPHPGEILREEFLKPLDLTAGRLAKACGIHRSRMDQIVAEKIGISGDTALRLGRVLGTGPELWMNITSRFEVEHARRAAGHEIEGLRPILGAAA